MDTNFIAELSCMDDNGAGDETVDDTIIPIEVVNVDAGGVLIAFDDRNERVYLKFFLEDLVAAAMRQAAK